MCPARATAGARHAPGLVMMGDILGDELRLAVCRHLLLDDRGCVRPGSHINWSQSLQSVAREGAGVFRRSSGTRAAAAQCGAPAAQKHVFPGPRVPACIRRRRAASLRGGARGAWPHGGSRATAAGWPWERRGWTHGAHSAVAIASRERRLSVRPREEHHVDALYGIESLLEAALTDCAL